MKKLIIFLTVVSLTLCLFSDETRAYFTRNRMGFGLQGGYNALVFQKNLEEFVYVSEEDVFERRPLGVFGDGLSLGAEGLYFISPRSLASLSLTLRRGPVSDRFNSALNDWFDEWKDAGTKIVGLDPESIAPKWCISAGVNMEMYPKMSRRFSPFFLIGLGVNFVPAVKIKYLEEFMDPTDSTKTLRHYKFSYVTKSPYGFRAGFGVNFPLSPHLALTGSAVYHHVLYRPGRVYYGYVVEEPKSFGLIDFHLGLRYFFYSSP